MWTVIDTTSGEKLSLSDEQRKSDAPYREIRIYSAAEGWNPKGDKVFSGNFAQASNNALEVTASSPLRLTFDMVTTFTPLRATRSLARCTSA